MFQCLGENEDALAIFDSAMQKMENGVVEKNIEEAIASVFLASSAIKQAQTGFESCGAMKKSNWTLTASTKTLVTPQIMTIEGSQLQLNGQDIMPMLSNIVAAFEKRELQAAGVEMAKILKSNFKKTDDLFLF